MKFEHAWVFFSAFVPLGWAGYSWWRKGRDVRLFLKCASIALMMAALSMPTMDVSSSKVAVALLVDTSASISPPDLQIASRFANDLNAERGSHFLRVLPFAGTTRDPGVSESGRSWMLRPTSGEGARSTDLEAAIRDAISTLPSDQLPRIAIASDGRETKGSLIRAAWQARRLGIPIDTIPLSGRTPPRVHLGSVQMPTEAVTGEPFSIDMELRADNDGPVDVTLSAEDHVIARAHAVLRAGMNHVLLHTSLNTPGALEIAIAIHAGSDGASDVRFDQSILMKRPRVLYLTGDQPALDADLLRTLGSAQFDVVRATAIENAAKFSEYQVVVLNNWALDKVTPPFQAALEAYVKAGGGLLVIGGERNLYGEGSAVGETLDRILPAKLSPRAPDGRAVILVMDRSTSMLGPKIDFARKAAAGIVEHLTPIDQIGVLVFDTTFLWQVPMRFADNRESINWMISRITANGGTRIAPALNEGYREMLLTPAFYKHIILLTDGLSDEGNSMNLARESGENAITISTVGLGKDVSRDYLRRIASLSGGKSYLMEEPEGLEQIVISDVKEHTGMAAVESPIVPEILHPAEILDGVDIKHAPALKGYIRFEPKPTSETVLRVEQKNPLLTRWQYGLGRAAIFTSDAKSMWAADWVAWKGYDKFWVNVVRDLLPHAHAARAELVYESASGELVASYQMDSRAATPARIPSIYAIGPEGFQRTVPIKKLGNGAYRGAVHIGSREGLFRVRPLEESALFPEAGLYRPEAELSVYGSDEDLLRRVATFTGGRFQPSAQNVFSDDGRSIRVVWALWPWLLAMGIALSLGELALRKRRRHYVQ
ncbi:MAG: VWA domain-containing protein [Bryobacteraceae bacterium]